MKTNLLTAEQAEKIVGDKMISELDGLDCEPTGRLMGGSNDLVEFSASLEGEDLEGESCTVVVYYYQLESDLEETEDLSYLEWIAEGYEII